jgi:hypothetical protein
MKPAVMDAKDQIGRLATQKMGFDWLQVFERKVIINLSPPE